MVKRVLDVGNWRPEGSPFNVGWELMTADPIETQLRSTAKYCFTKSIPGNVMNFSDRIPSEVERVEFGKRVVEELNNINHHLYFIMHQHRNAMLIVDI